jgi:uncharacterized protein (TIGR03643 family)
MTTTENTLNSEQIDRIIEMAWEDRTPFEAIEFQFGLNESQVKTLMQEMLKPASYRRWRIRVTNRSTKHLHKRTFTEGRFKCTMQRQISLNKISKRG